MLPLHKLEELPRSQRLRKIAKLFAEAEHRLGRQSRQHPGEVTAPENSAYLADIAALLTGDDAFAPAALEALRAAQAAIEAAAVPGVSGVLQTNVPDAVGLPVASVPLLRAINTIRHILRAETGQQTADWDFIDHEGRLDPEKRRSFPGMRVYLEDIRSPYNVGAMFRTAESFGVEKMFLSPLCADPLHPRAERTAMGCVSLLPWERMAQDPARFPTEALEGPFFALETGGTPLSAFKFPQRAVMIAGSEELGTSPEALALADGSLGRVTIPTYGAKGSLNVSVAFGIVLHAWAASLIKQVRFT
ncbi:hypothetical protein FACS189493_5330 [Spirochaetia bacterium]|nr:hypothetical protein FACS189493_5330 [Spirochaetia bacterium]